MSNIKLPELPGNVSHVMRRIRACESEIPAQIVLEHALHAYAEAAIIADRERQAGEAVAWTDEAIEALAFKHEAFGFGRVDAKGLTTHGFDPEGLRAFARELLASLPAPQALLAGWKLVPLEPTPKMWTAGGRAIKECGGHERDAASLAYAAMLAAATSPVGKAEQAEAPSERRERLQAACAEVFSEQQTEEQRMSSAIENHVRERIDTYADKHPTLIVRHLATLLRSAWATQPTASPEQAEAPSGPLCANCGKEGAAIHEGDAEGDVWCSSECYDQHGELGCPHETHNGFRHPVESRRLIECENVLRSLASWLGAGGYNAPTVDPKVFEEKIRWGVEEAIKDAVRIATQPTASNAGEREALELAIRAEKDAADRDTPYGCRDTLEKCAKALRAALATKPPAEYLDKLIDRLKLPPESMTAKQHIELCDEAAAMLHLLEPPAGEQKPVGQNLLTEEEQCALQYCEHILYEIEVGRVLRSDESHVNDYRAATITDAKRMAAVARKRVNPVFARLMRATAPQPEQVAQDGGKKLWLWQNFVDGRPEYWAFDNPFPVHLDCGDPQTLGEPVGYALLKPSRPGRTDVSEEQVLQRIRAAK